MTASPAKISTAFRPLYTSKKRYFLLTGGRGSLKSSTVHDFVARLTYESGHGILFTRYTLTSAELSIIPEFRTTLQRLGIESDFKITKQTITNRRTGSFIYFSGIKTSSGNQTAKLKSIAGITTWIIEEGEDFHDEKAFDDIDNSIRTTTRQNRIIWIQNPTTHEHFIYKRFVEPNNRQLISAGFRVTVSNMPQVEHIHVTYHLAESLGYLEKAGSKKPILFIVPSLRKYSEQPQPGQNRRMNWRWKLTVSGTRLIFTTPISGDGSNARKVLFSTTGLRMNSTTPFRMRMGWTSVTVRIRWHA